MKKTLLFLISFFFCMGASAAWLVRNGEAVSEIVVSAEAEPSVKVAAEQIQKYIEKMSGARLEIVQIPTGRMSSKIYVGQSDVTREAGFTLEEVRHDGFKIVAGSDTVIVAGNDIDWYSQHGFSTTNLYKVQNRWEEFTGHKWRSPMFLLSREWMVRSKPEIEFHPQTGCGTLHGAYELLRQLGFRWYVSFPSPDEELGQVIPSLRDIEIADQTTVCNPEFAIRNFGYYVSSREDALWVKYTGAGMAEFQIPWHSSGRILDYKEDPGIAGIINGKPDFTAPKLSGEKFRTTFMEYLDCVNRWYPKHLPFVSFCQPDGWSTIDDEDVRKGWDRLETRGPGGRFSDYNWDFALDMRERYNRKYPDNKQRKLVYAYSGTRRIPETLTEIPDDMTIYFTHNSSVTHLNDYRPHAEEWLAMVRDIRQFVVYDYYYEHTLYRGEKPPLPYVFTENLRKNFDFMYDRCNGWLLEGMVTDMRGGKARGFYRPMINHLMFYLRNRLSWDRNLDLETELTEYCELFYGPAADEMRSLLRFSEEIWMRNEPRQITASTGYIREEDVPRIFEMLERARSIAGESVYGRRIDRLADEMELLKTVFEKLQRRGPDLRAFRYTDGQTPLVDGDLTKPFWWYRSKINPRYSFYGLRDLITGDVPQHISTTVAFRYVGDSLYIGIRCLEPKMDRIQARCTENDNSDIWAGDFVEIRVETPNGRQPLIVVNPNGAVYDSDATMPKVEDLPIFYKIDACAVQKLPDQWTVELKVNASALEASMPTKSLPWGIQVSRQRMAGKTPEYYQLSPTGVAFNRHFEMMAKLHAQ